MRGAKGRTGRIQRRYVRNRIAGMNKKESAIAAGYSPCTRIDQIERPGGPVANLMVEALNKAGLDETMMAAEFKKGLKGCISGDKELRDYTAHAKYLLQLSYLRGYAKHGQGATVAIQNNFGKADDIDGGSIEDLEFNAKVLLRAVEEEAGRRGLSGFLKGDTEAILPEAHSGMGEDTQVIRQGSS